MAIYLMSDIIKYKRIELGELIMENKDKKEPYDKHKSLADKIIHEVEEVVEGITHEVEHRVEMFEAFVKDEVTHTLEIGPSLTIYS